MLSVSSNLIGTLLVGMSSIMSINAFMTSEYYLIENLIKSDSHP